MLKRRSEAVCLLPHSLLFLNLSDILVLERYIRACFLKTTVYGKTQEHWISAGLRVNIWIKIWKFQQTKEKCILAHFQPRLHSFIAVHCFLCLQCIAVVISQTKIVFLTSVDIYQILSFFFFCLCGWVDHRAHNNICSFAFELFTADFR